MSDEQKYVELATRIVSEYLRCNPVVADQVPLLISTVHQALAGLGRPGEQALTLLRPAVPIRRSVERDFVVCLDCGWRGSMLRHHLKVRHNLDPTQYRIRWEL